VRTRAYLLLLLLLLVLVIGGIAYYTLHKSPAPNATDKRIGRNLNSPGMLESTEATGLVTPGLISNRNILSDLLRQLTSLARRIEDGKETLASLRAMGTEPDSLMWELRLLVHSDPALLSLVAAFLKDGAGPIGARLLVAFALAQSEDKAVNGMLAEAIVNCSDDSVAIAISLSFSAYAGQGIGRAWNSLFAHLRSLTGKAAYSRGDEGLVFVPADAERHLALFRGDIRKSDLSEVARSIMDRLTRSPFAAFRGTVMDICWQMLDRPQSTDQDRSAFHQIAARSYLQADGSWSEGLKLLTHPRRGFRPGDLDVVALGLQPMDIARRAVVLERLSSTSTQSLFAPQFEKYVAESLAYLSLTPEQGGSSTREFTQLCWSLLVDSPDGWAADNLLAHESLVLRRRMASCMEYYAASGISTREKWQRVLFLSRSMWSDSDSVVRWNAASAMSAVLQQKRTPLELSELESVREQLVSWIEIEGKRDLGSVELERLESVRRNLTVKRD
jgi:hypothetical protein